MLKVCEYLQNKSYEDLENELGIRARVYDDRVVLNYSQIDSAKHDPIVRECRALILSRPDHKVLSRCFDRFYNYGEDPETESFIIDKIQEKVDGSICPVYHDGDKWQVATRSMAFAEGETASGRTYRDVFMDAIGGDPNHIFKLVDSNLTVIFELVSPESRVVKPYQEACVYLLDVRDRNTGLFLGQETSWYWGIPDETKWKYPEKFEFESWDDCLYAVKKLPALDEGYVALDKDNKRIKVKNPAYLAIANLRLNGIINEKRIILLVLMNDHEEYLNYFPEDQGEFDPYLEAYESMVLDIDRYWVQYKDLENQKEFAMAIKDCHAKSILFGMRNKQMKIQDRIDSMTDGGKERLLKGYVGST